MNINGQDFIVPRDSPTELIEILKKPDAIAIFVDNQEYEDMIIVVSKKLEMFYKIMFGEFESIFKKDNKKLFMNIGLIFNDKLFDGPVDSVKVSDRTEYDTARIKQRIAGVDIARQKYTALICFQSPMQIFHNNKNNKNYLFVPNSGELVETSLPFTTALSWERKLTEDIRFSYKNIKHLQPEEVMFRLEDDTLYITTISNTEIPLSEYAETIYNSKNPQIIQCIQSVIGTNQFKYVAAQGQDLIVYPKGEETKFRYIKDLNGIDCCGSISEVCEKTDVLFVKEMIYNIKTGEETRFDSLSKTLFINWTK